MNGKKKIKNLFNELSIKYDFFNDLFSLGLHRVWKRKFINRVRPSKGELWIDVCCGTGDVTFLLAELLGKEGKVVGIDSANMTLEIAKKRNNKNKINSITWVKSDIFNDELNLPLFDGAVISYGLRNLIDVRLGLLCIKRLIKSGGTIGVLDFNTNKLNSIKDKFQKFYLSKIIIPITTLLGFKDHFKYLNRSLKTYPDGRTLKKICLEEGFIDIRYDEIAFGQMGILIMKKM